jgi:hypothetical protein
MMKHGVCKSRLSRAARPSAWLGLGAAVVTFLLWATTEAAEG